MAARGTESIDLPSLNSTDVSLTREEQIVNLNGSIAFTFSSSGFDNPLDHPAVKAFFILLYSAVFLVCCIGNSLVLYTIGRNKRMRTRTNFFLANLAGADLAVGVLCVLPKLSTYMSLTWLLGEAMCKIYYFVQSLTYTASVLLLTAVAVERYIAILHPLRSRSLVTPTRLVVAQVVIWVISAAYNAPELTMFNLVAIEKGNSTYLFCFCTKPYTNMRNYYTINFGLWYILPLSAMTYMYLRVAYALWESCKLAASNDIRLKTVAHQRPCARQKSQLCCETNVDECTARKPRVCITKVNGHYVGHGTILEDHTGELAWPQCCSSRPSHRRTFSPGDGDMRMSLAVLLCTSRKNRHSCCAGNQRHICSCPNGIIESNARDSCEQRLLKATELTTPATCQTCSPGSALSLHHHQDGRGPRIPSYNQFSTCSNHKTYMSPACRTRRSSTFSEFTAEGSETTSTEEYDMQIPKKHGGKPSIPRRVRVQYRANSQRALQSRKRVIRLLVVVLLTFAVSVLPFHLKFILMFWNIYPTPSSQLDILSPLAYVLLYMNSSLNPILFWVFSDTFRRSLRDSLSRGCFRRHENSR